LVVGEGGGGGQREKNGARKKLEKGRIPKRHDLLKTQACAVLQKNGNAAMYEQKKSPAITLAD